MATDKSTRSSSILPDAFRGASIATSLAYAGLAFFVAAAAAVFVVTDAWSAPLLASAVLVLGIVGTAGGRLLQARSGGLKLLGTSLAWVISGLAFGSGILVLSVLATGKPDFAAVNLARLFRDPGFLLLNRGPKNTHVTQPGERSVDTLPEEFTATLRARDQHEKIRQLQKLPQLELNGTVLSLAGPEDRGKRISASRLVLKGNAAIVTNGGNLEIEVIDLEVSAGRVASFIRRSTPPAAEADQQGRDGRSGGVVKLLVHGTINGRLPVDLSGEDGGMGSSGIVGQPGASGAPGDRASSGLFDCRRGPGAGKPGLPGGPGGAGRSGGNGGDGGRFIVVGNGSDKLLGAFAELFTAKGGEGGPGGPGGPGGDGGPGGPGGFGEGLCSGGGPRGPSGQRGAQGQPGSAGKRGTDTAAPVFFTFAGLGGGT